MKSLRKHLFFVTVLVALLTPIFCGAQPDASPRNVVSRIDNIAEKNITTDDALNARATANTTKSRTSNATRANANRGRESSRTTNARKTNERNTTNRGNARNSGREVANAGRATQSRTARASNTRTKAVTARSSSTQSRAATASRVARSATNAKTVARAGTTNNAATRSAIPGRVATNASRAAASTTAKRARNTTATALTSGGAITLMEQCKTQYTQCMDNFCDVLDDAQGRCSCSKNIKNYSKTTAAQKEANQALQDIAQQIQYIGLTKDEVETLFAQTEAELTMQGASDNSQIKNSLDKIKDMIVEVKPANASNTDTDTGMSFNLDGLLDFSFNSTSIDLMELFGGNQSNTATISNQRGEQLYKTASARCKKTVLETCEAQGVNVSLITNSYDMEIDRACIAYERSLTEGNDNIEQTVRNAQSVLQRARLMVAQQKNAYDLRGCISALDSCMQDDYVCGSDYELCLDPTGKYIVDGEVVVGSTPGYILDGADNMSPAEMYSADTLMSAWYYDDGNMFAWGKDNTEGTLADYINDSVESAVKELDGDSNMAEYLQYKIGYNDSGKNYGMCMSVLNKCQDITYDNGKYIPDNQVIKEYLSRTLVQIKAAQDEILADYAESCITDVSSCLSSNNFDLDASDSRQNIAINACRSQIKTCMSVNGNTAIAPSPESIKNWIIAMMGGEVAPETPDDGGDDTPGTGGDDTPGTGGDDTPENPTLENPYIDNNPETTMTVKNTIVDEDTNTTVLLVEDTDTDACYATVPQADGSYDPTELGACIVDCETGTTSSDVCDDENIVTLVNGAAGGATTYSLRGGTSGAPTLMFDGKAVNELKLALNNGELPTDITWIKNLAQGTNYTFEGIADASGNEYYNRLGVRQKATATPGIVLSVMFEYDAIKAACNGTWDEENQSCNCSALAGAIYDEDSASCVCDTNAGFAAGVPTAVAGCACESGKVPAQQDGVWTCLLEPEATKCAANAKVENCTCDSTVGTAVTVDGTNYCLDADHQAVFNGCTDGTYDVETNTCQTNTEPDTPGITQCAPNAELYACSCDRTVGTLTLVYGTDYCLDDAHKTVFDGCTNGTYDVETNTCTPLPPNICAPNAVVENCTCDSTIGTKTMVNSIYYCLNAETLASFESCRKDKGRYVVETGMCYGSAPQCEATGGTWTYDPNTCECPAGKVYQPSSTKCISLIEDFCAKNYKTLDAAIDGSDLKGYRLRSSYSTYPGAEYIGTVSLGDTATPQSGDECGYVFRDKAEWYHGNVCYLAAGGHVVSLVDCELAESGHIRNAVWVKIDGLREETSRIPTFEIARLHPLEFYIVGSGTDGNFPSLTEHANYKLAYSQDDGHVESTYTDDEFKFLGVFRYPGGKGVQLYDENGEQTEYMANFHRQHDAYLDATDGTALHVYWEDVQNPASRDLTHLQDMTMCNAYHETYCPCYDSKMLLIDSECNVVYTRYGMYTGGDEGLAMCAAQNSGQIEAETLANDIRTEGYNGWADVQTITTADSVDSFAYPWQCGMSVREAYEDDLSQCFVFRGAAARKYTTRVPTLDSQGMAMLLSYGAPILVDPGYCNASSPVKSIPVNKTITVDTGDALYMYIGGTERYDINVAIPDQAGKTPPSLTPFINRSNKESSGQVFYGVFENEDFSGVQYYDATGNWIDNEQTRAKVAALGPEGNLKGYMWWTHVNDQLTFLKPVANQAECLSKNGTYQSPNRCYCDGAKFLKADKNQETCVCYDTTNSGLSDMTFDTQTRACTCKGALNVVHTLEPVYYCGIPTNKGFRAQDDASTGQSAKQQCEAGHGTYYEAPPYPWDNCLCNDGYATYDVDATTCVEEINYEALCTDNDGTWHGDRCTCPAEGYAWSSTSNKCVTHDKQYMTKGCVESGGTWYEYKEAPNTPSGHLPQLEHCDCSNNTVNPDATWWHKNGNKCVPYDLKLSTCKSVWGGDISYNEALGKDVCTYDFYGERHTEWVLGTTMYYESHADFSEECSNRFGHFYLGQSGIQYASGCECSADVPNATGELDAEGKCGCQEGYTRVWISNDRKMKCIK